MRFTILIAVTLSCFLLSCSMAPTSGPADEIPRARAETASALPTASQTPQAASSPEMQATPEEEYPGIDISETFPPQEIASRVADEEKYKRAGRHRAEVGRSIMTLDEYTPVSLINEDSKEVRIKTRYPGEYWSYALGSARVLGDSSDVLYVLYTGPGGVCCSQIQLFDVSENTPRSIFNSEEFGSFRDWTEIFDAEGDGVLELAKWDSCFRYFMGDCGSCSPQPKAVFKYDRKERKYLPAKGVQQDFAKLYLQRDEQWIIEQHRLWKEGKLETWLDLDRAVLKHVVDLLWLGEEDKAWTFFDQYKVWEKDRVKKEIKERLKECPYYQAIRKLP